MSVEEIYAKRLRGVLPKIARAIESDLTKYLDGEPRIDRISARAKSIDRFIAKANKKNDSGDIKYTDPIFQIQDQVGARIVTFYPDDVDRVSKIVERYFKHIEAKRLVPESDWAFGYFGKHYIFYIPGDMKEENWDSELVPEFFELQIKTLFQHAWSEANHDLGYKPGVRELTSDEYRQLAFTAAQAWGADRIFNDLFQAS